MNRGFPPTRRLARASLERENETLRRRLEEAEEALGAIRAGEVDAVFVERDREQVFTLERAYDVYRLVVARIPQAAVTLTAEGSIISCNRRFADLLRQPPSALYGRPIHDFVVSESQDTLGTLLGDAATAEAQTWITLLRDDGTTTAVYLGVAALREGALGLCLVVTDLTEQHRYEELQRAQRALRDSEERLERDLAAAERLQEVSTRLIQQGKGEELYYQILDAATDILRSDFATMQIFDPTDQSLRVLAHRGFDEDFAESLRQLDAEGGTTCALALREGRRIVAPEIESFEGIAGTDACEALLAMGVRAAQSTPLLSRAGDVLGMISTHWAAPHEPAERDLRLLDVLARQAADLIERTRREQALREADRRKDEFLATLAHELRNPLAPIRNAVQILETKGPARPELQFARAVIERQVTLMARLLDDLLDVARIVHERPELHRERVDLATVLDAALETSGPLIEAAHHELHVAVPSEPIHLDADPVRLAQVFGNLLNNAAKYTEEGGRIQVTAERQGSNAVVSVKDSGIGIDSELLPRVFELFSQAKPTMGRAQGGLGIGLSLVKGLVELHGGSVQARSEGPGKGSEFVVRLPVVAEGSSEEGSGSDVAAAERSRNRRRILVVDDNRDSADSLAMLLEVMGHEVSTAYDGEHAIETASARRPELVLLDIGMPKVDGHAACRRIRKEPWGRDVCLVAMTGWGQDEDRQRSEEAGFDRHVVKPVDLVELVALLDALPARQADERSAAEGSPRVES